MNGIFGVNYYDITYNCYWFVFSIIAVGIPIGSVTFKGWAERKNTYAEIQIKTG